MKNGVIASLLLMLTYALGGLIIIAGTGDGWPSLLFLAAWWILCLHVARKLGAAIRHRRQSVRTH